MKETQNVISPVSSVNVL